MTPPIKARITTITPMIITVVPIPEEGSSTSISTSYRDGSNGKASAPSSTVQSSSGSLTPSPSLSRHPRLSILDVPKTEGQASAPSSTVKFSSGSL